eukprot:2434298-Rhodomonas_salina.2
MRRHPAVYDPGREPEARRPGRLARRPGPGSSSTLGTEYRAAVCQYYGQYSSIPLLSERGSTRVVCMPREATTATPCLCCRKGAPTA